MGDEALPPFSLAEAVTRWQFAPVVTAFANQPGTAPMGPADAFVLTHAVAGVLRALIVADGSDAPPPAEVEAALTRLILGTFIAAPA